MLRTSQALVFLVIATAASGALIAQRASTAAPCRDAGRRLADLQPRSGRHALLAARRDHAGQRVHAGSGVGLPHEAGRAGGAATPATPEATLPPGHETPPAPAPPAPGQPAAAPAPIQPGPTSTSSNQSRGRRGFASSESTPLVVGGVLYMSTPYARVVALDPAIGEGEVGVPAALGQPVDARPGVLARRRHDAGADRLRDQRREALLDRRRDRQAQSRVRRRRRRQPQHAGDPARPAGAQRPDLAADRLQAPRHHRRHDAGEPAARAGRRRARLGHAHRQAGVDVPLGAAARASDSTTPGPATAGRTARASTSGASSPWTRRAASSTCRSGRRRSISTAAIAPATTCSAPAWSRPTPNTGKYLWHFQLTHHDIWDADSLPRRCSST